MANATDLSFRSPKSTNAVLPIFRQDATPIPDYFLDQIMPKLKGIGQLKTALAIFRLMHKAGDTEIITFIQQLAYLTNVPTQTVYGAIDFFRNESIFLITALGPAEFSKGNASPKLLQIKFINRVNYSRID